MPLYDDLRKQFGETSPEVKLNVLRYEMHMKIEAVRGVAEVLKQINPEEVHGLPSNFGYFVDTLTKAGENLRAILDALTEPQNLH